MKIPAFAGMTNREEKKVEAVEEVVLVIHMILALAIIGLVLLQRSEGGGLGIGSSGGMGAFASARTTANVLSRSTAICAAGFFCTSLILGILSGHASRHASIIDKLDQAPPATSAPAIAGTTVDHNKPIGEKPSTDTNAPAPVAKDKDTDAVAEKAAAPAPAPAADKKALEKPVPAAPVSK